MLSDAKDFFFEDPSTWDQSTLDPPPYKGAMKDIASTGVHKGDTLYDSLPTSVIMSGIHNKGIGLPDSDPPPWDVDWKQIQRGQQTWRDLLGPTSVSLSGALLLGFSIHRFAEVLILSGYANSADSNFMRYQATAYHTQDWMRFALNDTNSPARMSIKQVRAMHSLARRKTISKNLFSSESNGIPLSQYDLAETLFAFSSVSIEIINHVFNVSHQLTDPKKEDMIAVWRLIGYYLGIEDEYNVCNSVAFNKKCFADWHSWSVARISTGGISSKRLVEMTCEGFGRNLPAGKLYWKAFYVNLIEQYNVLYKCNLNTTMYSSGKGLTGVSRFINFLLPLVACGPVSRRIRDKLYIERDAYYGDRTLFNRIQQKKKRASRFSDVFLWPSVCMVYSLYEFMVSKKFMLVPSLLLLYHFLGPKATAISL
eukprot:TRINITY_DN6644_c0_g2_i1.p1 TRINITY_DN6644_c0_g2~~TRINITY_DN6644_c0_g2_i1.p1  ORF type:complete len:424 (+),score=34.03 TRINITY_DN6644_c0_g2_i1:67-1338(+)